jgi:hypothetical protein
VANLLRAMADTWGSRRRIDGSLLLPGTAMLEMMVAATRTALWEQPSGRPGAAVTSIAFTSPLRLGPSEDGAAGMAMVSCALDLVHGWMQLSSDRHTHIGLAPQQMHALGGIASLAANPVDGKVTRRRRRPSCSCLGVKPPGLPARSRRTLAALRTVDEAPACEAFCTPIAPLDSCLQLGAVAPSATRGSNTGGAQVPASLQAFAASVGTEVLEMWGTAGVPTTRAEHADAVTELSFAATSSAPEWATQFQQFLFKALTAEQAAAKELAPSAARQMDCLYQVAWPVTSTRRSSTHAGHAEHAEHQVIQLAGPEAGVAGSMVGVTAAGMAMLQCTAEALCSSSLALTTTLALPLAHAPSPAVPGRQELWALLRTAALELPCRRFRGSGADEDRMDPGAARCETQILMTAATEGDLAHHPRPLMSPLHLQCLTCPTSKGALNRRKGLP